MGGKYMNHQSQAVFSRNSRPVVVMNFTGVYNYESFARNCQFVWLDCQHLNGTECYCDDEGASALQRMIADYSPQGNHFKYSGNYHYVTKF